jgi:hypothetical protein
MAQATTLRQYHVEIFWLLAHECHECHVCTRGQGDHQDIECPKMGIRRQDLTPIQPKTPRFVGNLE